MNTEHLLYNLLGLFVQNMIYAYVILKSSLPMDVLFLVLVPCCVPEERTRMPARSNYYQYHSNWKSIKILVFVYAYSRLG